MKVAEVLCEMCLVAHGLDTSASGVAPTTRSPMGLRRKCVGCNGEEVGGAAAPYLYFLRT